MVAIKVSSIKFFNICILNIFFKKLKNSCDEAEQMDLIKEAIISMNLKHKNFLEFYGICLGDKCPKYIVLEYADLGDLLGLLRKHRSSQVVSI